MRNISVKVYQSCLIVHKTHPSVLEYGTVNLTSRRPHAIILALLELVEAVVGRAAEERVGGRCVLFPAWVERLGAGQGSHEESNNANLEGRHAEMENERMERGTRSNECELRLGKECGDQRAWEYNLSTSEQQRRLSSCDCECNHQQECRGNWQRKLLAHPCDLRRQTRSGFCRQSQKMHAKFRRGGLQALRKYDTDCEMRFVLLNVSICRLYRVIKAFPFRVNWQW